MAVRFDGSSCLWYAGNPLLDGDYYSHTISAWIRPAAPLQTASGMIAHLNYLHATLTYGSHLYLRYSAPDYYITARYQDSGDTSQQGVSYSWNAGEWYHVAAVFGTVLSVRAGWLNGRTANDWNTYNVSGYPFYAPNSVQIGALTRNDYTTLTQQFTGDIAEVAVWEEAFDASQLAPLAQGASPLSLHRPSLRFYAPLRDSFDVVQFESLSGTSGFGTTGSPIVVSDHPPQVRKPLFYFALPQSEPTGEEVAGVGTVIVNALAPTATVSESVFLNGYPRVTHGPVVSPRRPHVASTPRNQAHTFGV